MKRRPLILVTACTQRAGAEFSDLSISLSECYPRAVAAARGLPWVLPRLPDEAIVAESVERCDGVLLTGGDDLQPRLYANRLGGKLKDTVHSQDAPRDLLELLLLREVFRRRKPMLAICRGQQVLNVALGGTLVVDIESQMPGALRHHRMDRKDEIVHKVTLTPGSILHRIHRTRTLAVNSVHHQAVGRVARPLRAPAASADGVVEGMEWAGADDGAMPWLVAVQFHPERLFETHGEFLKLFEAFTRACRPSRNRSL
jgi:putative glutamine amidotransferase